MTLTLDDVEKVNSMIRTQILSTVIASPRFTDYHPQEILNVESPSAISNESASSESGSSGGGSAGGGFGAGDITTGLSLAGGGGSSALQSRVSGLLGVGGPLTTALLVEPIGKQVIEELQRPGGFLDKRVRIDAREEAFAELDRQTRQNTRIGDRQVIIQQFDGFRNFDGIASTNTSRLIRENADRVLDIGLFERASGVR